MQKTKRCIRMHNYCIGYRLAPNHKFFAALEDCLKAMC
ncbi:alpha/beta hydrolase [Coxiella endosymbiont of Ornithodoros amblus]|nr:alpha/beta hydrolase [Coxiella endosymbiont of Ornithodoros amblus]